MKPINDMLTPVQRRLVAIIERINGPVAAKRLAATYRKHNRLWKSHAPERPDR